MALSLPNVIARLYPSSRQLIAGDDFNNIVAQLNSNETGITASTVQTQAGARQLSKACNLLSTVANANDAIKLPKGIVGLEVWIQNAGAQSAQVYTYGTGTINGTDGVATGVALAVNANSATLYKCLSVGTTEVWITK